MTVGFRFHKTVHIQKDGMKMFCGINLTGKDVEEVNASDFKCVGDYPYSARNRDLVVRCTRCNMWFNYGKEKKS